MDSNSRPTLDDRRLLSFVSELPPFRNHELQHGPVVAPTVAETRANLDARWESLPPERRWTRWTPRETAEAYRDAYAIVARDIKGE